MVVRFSCVFVFVFWRIGLAIAKLLAEEGASIVVNSRKQENVDKTVEQFRQNGVKATGIVCNVGNAEDRSKLLEHVTMTSSVASNHKSSRIDYCSKF